MKKIKKLDWTKVNYPPEQRTTKCLLDLYDKQREIIEKLNKINNKQREVIGTLNQIIIDGDFRRIDGLSELKED